MWRLDWDWKSRPSGNKDLTLPMNHHAPHFCGAEMTKYRPKQVTELCMEHTKIAPIYTQ